MEQPRQVGKYELVRKLASGGMAEVFLARAAGPAGFQKTLVVKRILPHLAENPKFVEMFLAEARLAAALNHPGVVQIFDFGEADDAYYLAMEYVDGPDLGSLWRAARGRLPIAHAVKIMSLACEGLDYAHEFRDAETGKPLNIVHRDVSPDNILLARTGAVKVTDFGVAKAATSSQHTQAGTLKGKFAYMAPEQLRGKPLDRRADVYSAAATLYEALAGNRLFDAEGDAQLLNAVANEPHIPIRARRSEVPEALARILDKALSKDPAQRHPTCRAFGSELENFLRASNAVVGSYELSSLVAELADKVSGPWNPNIAQGRSGMKSALRDDRAAPAKARGDTATRRAVAAPNPVPQGTRERAALKPVPVRRDTPRESPRPAPRSAPSQPLLAERLKDLARLDAVREWAAAMKDPAQRRQAIAAAKAFPRSHPLETALGAGSVVLVFVTLWILVSALIGSMGLEDSKGLAFFEVQSEPPARLRVNGEDHGRTPQRVQVDPGPVRLELYDETLGFRKEETFNVFLGNNPARKFAIGMATVEFKIFPKGTVYVDGRRLGEAPMAPTPLYEGKHSVRITNPEFKHELAFELNLKAGEKTTVQKSFLNL